jgi:hypothetical protein
MAKIKTAKTKADPITFIKALPDERKKADSLQLTEMMTAITGEEPYMYGPTIVGFGNYHYVYESGHEGDAPLAAFSPRKDALTVYIMNFPGKEELLEQLGKYKGSKGCLYIKNLDDISIPVLKKLVKGSMTYLKKQYPQ